MQKDSVYFSHDCNASEDIKIMRAEEKFGDIAYCWFFKTIELLRQQRYLQLEFDDMGTIHKKVKCPSVDMYKAFIQTSQLFEFNEKYFWSNSLIGRVGNVLLLAEKKSDASKLRWYNFYLSKGDNEKAMSYIHGLSNKKLLPNNIPSTPPGPPVPVNLENIKLPLIHFPISRDAETSWKACLFTCSKNYEQIKEIYHSTPETVFKSYQNFNKFIDDAESVDDLRTIRIANIQLDLQSYQKLCALYTDGELIKSALKKMVQQGVKTDHVIYIRLLQFIPYVIEENKQGPKNNGTNGHSKPTISGKQLIDGYYWVNNQKMLHIDINDMDQCRGRIKVLTGEVMDDMQITSLRQQKGDEAFKWFLEG